ncbi:hypothetical protein DPX16_20773 [Anabarilius grahami]|uniref:ribonuclease H n=1 Tax=Anabarilius grahami TaxID=495550 RepID=A0A3N0ZAD9_ANAGA|nr:hypothetical protein DPX16_20773 [Anabarilius grahami]
MADIILPPPAPFLALLGEPPIPWIHWLQSFETFILAVGLTDVCAARKKALLLHCLGAEGQRVLGTLESGTTSNYDTAIELLSAYLVASQSAPFSVPPKTPAARPLPYAPIDFTAQPERHIGGSRLQLHLPCCPSRGPDGGGMGLDLFSALGFSLVDMKGAAILTVSTPWQQKWPSMFEGLGCLTAFAHQPLLDPVIKPVIQPLHRIPLAFCDGVSAELKQLLDAGIIEPVDASPWVSNLVVTQKKSGALRVCVNLRAVNKAMIPDRFPLPTSEELIAQFNGSTVFSKLDFRQGYLQVPLHPSSRNLTAFVTHAGVFCYMRMPFGLSSAPSCCQKIMVSVLAGIPGVAIYLDDVVIHWPTTESHDERVSRVFAALAEHKLTINAENCVFSAPTIEYVGFRLSADVVTPLQSNVDAILAVPEPSSAA